MGASKKISKKGKKMKKNIVFCFKQISKCDTCFYMLFFKNIVFKSVALVTKKLWAIFRLFHRSTVYPTLEIKKKYYFNERFSKLLINLPPACLGLRVVWLRINFENWLFSNKVFL